MWTNSNSFSTLLLFPPVNGRYVVFDTETTGLEPTCNNVIEIGAVEVVNGFLTGSQFHAYLRPRFKMDKNAEEKHKMAQDFYQKFYKDTYPNERATLNNFRTFVGQSLIFAHNAKFDMTFINNELKYWNLPEFPKKKFRCTMGLFKKIFMPFTEKKCYALEFCCQHFGIVADENHFHSAIFDSFMTARMLCSMFKEAPKVRKERELREKESKINASMEESKNFSEGHFAEVTELTHFNHEENDSNMIIAPHGAEEGSPCKSDSKERLLNEDELHRYKVGCGLEEEKEESEKMEDRKDSQSKEGLKDDNEPMQLNQDELAQLLEGN